jgi:dienelactone hydrolase
MGISAAPGAWARTEAVPLALRDGAVIRAKVRWPDGSGVSAKLPAILLFGGFEHAAEVLDLVHPRVPVVMASFDYPFEGSREFRFPQTLWEAPALRRSVPATIEGIRLLARWLSAQPRVDAERLAIIGASFATPFVVAAAADEPEIRALVLVHGFGDVRGTLEHRLSQVFELRLGGAQAGAMSSAPWRTSLAHALARPAAWLIDSFLALPQPSEQAARLGPNQSVLMIEATEDQFIPPESRRALLDGLRRSRARVDHFTMPGGHLMPGSRALIERIMGTATGWMSETGFLDESPEALVPKAAPTS